MIIITATMKAKEGEADKMGKIIKEYMPKFLKDAGTVMYEVSQRADNKNVFFFYEKYQNSEALNQHSSAPHFKEMFRAIKPFLDGNPDIAMFEEI